MTAEKRELNIIKSYKCSECVVDTFGGEFATMDTSIMDSLRGPKGTKFI